MAPARQLHTIAAREAAAQEASTASHSLREMAGRAMGLSVKVGQLAEEDESVVDLLAGEFLEALGAKPLHRERAHDAAVEQGAPEGGRSELGLGGEVTKEPAGKAVARASRVDHLFQRQSRRPKGVGLRPFTF